MDSLTQIVLGAATGEAVLEKKVGNKAIFWGAIAGTIPDLDVLLKLVTDNVTANEMHRGFSHSIVFCVLFAPVFGWLISKIHKNQQANWKDWSKLMFWGLFTHPILDAFTTWGTQLFWPLNYKIAFKNIFVIDPLYTIPFMVCVIVAMFYKRSNPLRSKLNWFGILLSSSYLILTLIIKGFTYKIFQKSLEDQNISYKEIETKPTPFNSILWTANVETENAYLIGYYSLFDKNKTINYSEFPKNYHLLKNLNNDPLILRLKNLTENWYTIQQEGDQLYFNDLRFGLLGFRPENDKFVFSYELFKDASGKLQAKERQHNMKEAPELMGKLFCRVFP